MSREQTEDQSFLPALSQALNLRIGGGGVSLCDESVTDASKWQSTMDRCIPAVVSIKVNATRAFDTSMPGSSQVMTNALREGHESSACAFPVRRPGSWWMLREG